MKKKKEFKIIWNYIFKWQYYNYSCIISDREQHEAQKLEKD